MNAFGSTVPAGSAPASPTVMAFGAAPKPAENPWGSPAPATTEPQVNTPTLDLAALRAARNHTGGNTEVQPALETPAAALETETTATQEPETGTKLDVTAVEPKEEATPTEANIAAEVATTDNLVEEPKDAFAGPTAAELAAIEESSNNSIKAFDKDLDNPGVEAVTSPETLPANDDPAKSLMFELAKHAGYHSPEQMTSEWSEIATQEKELRRQRLELEERKEQFMRKLTGKA